MGFFVILAAVFLGFFIGVALFALKNKNTANPSELLAAEAYSATMFAKIKEDLELVADLNKKVSEIQRSVMFVNSNYSLHEKALSELPTKVLQSLTSSSNNKKGQLGEFIGYLSLSSSYDRIIPLGDIADFLCIKLPTEKEEGSIDFIEIKTGKSRLNKDQKLLQELVSKKNINFLKVNINAEHNQY